MKLLSIVIPMYNSKQFIGKCLDSLIVSTEMLENLEVIVVNDGSKDGCEDIVKNYVKKYPHSFILVNKENGGHGSAINVGIEYCSGKYFRVLDADDWVITKELERVIRDLVNTNAEVVVTGYKTFDITTKLECVQTSDIKARIELSMEDLLQNWTQYKSFLCIHGIIYNYSFYKNIDCKSPEGVYYDDAYYYTIPASCAKTFCILSHTVSIYRIGDVNQSVSVTNRINRIFQHEQVIKAMIEDYKKIKCKNQISKKYWCLKTGTTICDFFTTTLILFSDRIEGKRLAEDMMVYVKSSDNELYRSLVKRYKIYKMFYNMHIKEKLFRKIMCIRKNIV